MTSQKFSADKKAASFDFRRALRQELLPSLFALVCVLIPFFIIAPGNILYRITIMDEPLPQGAHISALAPEMQGFGIVCALLGVLFAATNFYITSKSSVNFHLSLPVTRSTLFNNRFLAAVICIAGSTGLVVAVDWLMNVSVLGDAAFLLKMALAMWLELFIWITASYTVCTLAMSATYTVIEGLFFSAGLLMLPTVLISAFSLLCSTFLNGYARGVDLFDFIFYGESYAGAWFNTSPLILLAVANPLTLGLVQTGVQTGADTVSDIFYLANAGVPYYYTDYSDSMSAGEQAVLPTVQYFIPLLVWAVLIVLLALLAKKLFVGRKAEKTALHASNPVATHLFALELGTATVAVVAVFITDMTNVYGTVLRLLLCIVSFAATALITLAVSKRQVIFRNKKAYLVPAVGTLCVAVLSVALATGGFGYTAYAPKADDIVAATITNAGIADMAGEVCNDVYSGSPFDVYPQNAIAVLEDKEDIALLLKEKDNIVANHRPKAGAASVNILYVTKSGKRIAREYATTPQAATRAAKAMLTTNAYKKGVTALLNGGDMTATSEKIRRLGLNDVFFINGISDSEDGTLTNFAKRCFAEGNTYILRALCKEEAIENTPELRAALAADITEMSNEQRFRPTEKELFRIVFEESESLADGTYGGCKYIVYPSMQHTVDYLKKQGVDVTPQPLVGAEFERAFVATVQDYKSGYFYGNNDNLFSAIVRDFYPEQDIDADEIYNEYSDDALSEYLKTVVTDKKEVQKLASVARSFAMLSDDDYVVAFKYKGKDEGGSDYERTQFMCIYKEDYPLN